MAKTRSKIPKLSKKLARNETIIAWATIAALIVGAIFLSFNREVLFKELTADPADAPAQLMREASNRAPGNQARALIETFDSSKGNIRCGTEDRWINLVEPNTATVSTAPLAISWSGCNLPPQYDMEFYIKMYDRATGELVFSNRIHSQPNTNQGLWYYTNAHYFADRAGVDYQFKIQIKARVESDRSGIPVFVTDESDAYFGMR